MDTGRVDPRVGSGGNILNALLNFAVFVVFLVEIEVEKCYISTHTLAKQQVILG